MGVVRQGLLHWAGRWPCLLIVSGSEEYVPQNVDVVALGQRLAEAIGRGSSLVVIEGAPHSLEGHEDQAAVAVTQFIAALEASQ